MAVGKAINQFDVATSAENKHVLGYDITTDVTCQIPTNLIKGHVPYDQVIRTQAEFNTLVASPTWLGAVTVALVGEFSSSANIIVPETVKRIDGYKCKITSGFECNGCIINDIEVVSDDMAFTGNNNTYTNCTGTGDNHGFYTDGGNNTYLNCTAIGGSAGIRCESSVSNNFMIIKNCKFPSKAGITTASTNAVYIYSADYDDGAYGVFKDCVLSTSFSTGISANERVVVADNFAILP